jgi:hypothetical protein
MVQSGQSGFTVRRESLTPVAAATPPLPGAGAGARALSTSVGVRGLPALLERTQPDAIIGTHFLPIEALTLIK